MVGSGGGRFVDATSVGTAVGAGAWTVSVTWVTVVDIGCTPRSPPVKMRSPTAQARAMIVISTTLVGDVADYSPSSRISRSCASVSSGRYE